MWSHTRELPIGLNAAVENQMNFIVSSSSSLIAIERTVIRELPFHLRNDLCMHLYKDILGACPFFRGRDAAFISQVWSPAKNDCVPFFVPWAFNNVGPYSALL